MPAPLRSVSDPAQPVYETVDYEDLAEAREQMKRAQTVKKPTHKSKDITWHERGDGKWMYEFQEQRDLRESFSRIRVKYSALHPTNSGLLLARKVCRLATGLLRPHRHRQRLTDRRPIQREGRADVQVQGRVWTR